MLQSKTLETMVGFFILLGMAGLLMLALKVSNLGDFGNGSGYKVEARFHNIGGLKVRAPVKMSGVRIGQVSSLSLDGRTHEAVAVLTINDRYDNIPVDTTADIYTAGLLGEQYISLNAGGMEEVLKDGSRLEITSDAVVLEKVIGQFLYNKAAGE